jgi:hypothetical protein
LFPIVNSNRSKNNTNKLDKLISQTVTPQILTTEVPEQKITKKVENKVKPVPDFIEQPTKEIDYDEYFKELGRDEIRNKIYITNEDKFGFDPDILPHYYPFRVYDKGMIKEAKKYHSNLINSHHNDTGKYIKSDEQVLEYAKSKQGKSRVELKGKQLYNHFQEAKEHDFWGKFE